MPLPLIATYTFACQLVAFHAVGLLFEAADRSGKLSSFKTKAVDRKPYASLLPRVLANQFLILLPAMLLLEKSGLAFAGQSHLPISRFFASLPIMAIGHDIIQYTAHRYLLHQPNLPLMRFLRHSLHHSTSASRGISACYMSAPDFVLEIILPYLLPLAIVGGGGADLRWHCMVAGLGAIGGVYEHSGYDFSKPFWEDSSISSSKGVNSSSISENEDTDDHITGLIIKWQPLRNILLQLLDNRSHSQHHSKGSVSFSDGFGSPGICDTFFGTRWDLAESRRRLQEANAEWQGQMATVNQK